jgi:hypothetical protein
MAWDGFDRVGTCSPSSPCGCAECATCQGLTLSTPRAIRNRPGLSSIGYRIGRHGDFKASLLARLSAVDPALPRLTTREDADFSVGLVDAFSTLAHVLTFYQERIAGESYLRTASERLSVRHLARELGYELGPGVAASTAIAFELDVPNGQKPARTAVGAGTQVQSVPGPGETAQVFETVESFEGRGEWNSLPVQVTETLVPGVGDGGMWLSGTSTQLKAGDALLLTGPGLDDGTSASAWYFRRIASVKVFPGPGGGSTRIEWEGALESVGGSDPLAGDPKVFALRLRANVFGYNAPLWKSIPDDMKRSYLGLAEGASLSGHLVEWPSYTIASPSLDPLAYSHHVKYKYRPDTLDLEAAYPEVRPGTWAILVSPTDGPTLSVVSHAVESGRAQFGLAGRTTRMVLDPDALAPFLDQVRTTTVFAHSDPLALAEAPARRIRVGHPLHGFAQDDGALAPLAGEFVFLQDLVPELPAGRTLVVRGKRSRVRAPHVPGSLSFSFGNGETRDFEADESLVVLSLPVPHPTQSNQWIWSLRDEEGIEGTTVAKPGDLRLASARAADDTVAEVVELQDSWAQAKRRTVLWLGTSLSNVFDAGSTAVLGNVARATHGQTRAEVLGSGDSTVAGQSFPLRQPPLTWVPSTDPGGVASTLHVYVNGVEWKEVPSFFGRGPHERIFVVRREETGGSTVRFGDGTAGARPATGQGNITARYRQGVGTGGNVKTGQLSILLNPPLGVRTATNPVAAAGGDDPETLDQARGNAPLSVLTLDRVVSADDFAHFARSFGGVHKAAASWFRSREREGVFLTLSGPAGAEVGSDSVERLLSAIAAAGDPHAVVRAATFRPAAFAVSARVRLADGLQSEIVHPLVESALRNAFGFEARGFSQPVYKSEIARCLHGVEGVESVVIDLLQRTDDTSVDVSDVLSAASADPATGKGAELLLLDPSSVRLGDLP